MASPYVQFCRTHGSEVRARLANLAFEERERAANRELDTMWRALSASERAALAQQALAQRAASATEPLHSEAGTDSSTPGLSQEQRMYAALRHSSPPRPAAKELKESLAFFYRCQKLLKGHDLVIDVAGSHGMLAMLYIAFSKCYTRRAVVLDPFRPRSYDSVVAAWAPAF